jgi:hypothetical protein
MASRWPFAALFVLPPPPYPVQSAEKTFQDAALDDAAIKLEADLKDEAAPSRSRSSRSGKTPTRACERAI